MQPSTCCSDILVSRESDVRFSFQLPNPSLPNPDSCVLENTATSSNTGICRQ